MIEVVEKFLDEFNLKNSENTLLVGFSGGCDSLCLLDILNVLSQKYGFKLVALHLNHNWRGEESMQDERNCAEFCEKHNIEYVFEVLEESGQKTESFAREARYNFFLKHAKNYKNPSVFTAHTQSDNAETIIFRIIKGTGIKGLQGILPKRIIDDIPIYRPLLSVSREQIEDYCNSKGLVANTDSSNFDINYKRNFIRHKIMPLFDEINFHAEKSIVSLSKVAISESNIVDEYISLIKKDVVEDTKLVTQKFRKLSDNVMRKFIYDACIDNGLEYDYKKINNILEFIKDNFDSKAGSRYSLTNDLWLFASSKYIYLITETKADKISNEIRILKEGEYDVLGTNYIFSIKKYEGSVDVKFPPESANYAYVNIRDLNFDFTLRTRRDGDFIAPFGMKGSMKLKKYLNSKEIPQHDKDNLIMLCQGAEALWVAGVGLNNKLKVVNAPTHVIELRNKN